MRIRCFRAPVVASDYKMDQALNVPNSELDELYSRTPFISEYSAIIVSVLMSTS